MNKAVTKPLKNPSKLSPKTKPMQKAIFLTVLVSAMLLTQVTLPNVVQNNAINGIKGNGIVVKKERAVSDFHAISVSGGIDIYIIPGQVEKAVVETDENLQEAVTTVVGNGVLKIYCGKSISHSKKMNVYVYVKQLDKITASGGCGVSAETNLNFPALSFDLSGGCDIKLKCTTNELKCSLTGGSDATLSGSAANAVLEATGGSDFKASGLTIKKCKIEVTGGSDADLYVTGELAVVASGSSDVTYSGNPKIISRSVTGASDLNKKQD